MPRRTVLIVGALGVVGRAALDLFTSDREHRTIGLSRRKPDFETGADWITADLMDREGLERAIAGVEDITHVVYAALHEEAGLLAGWNASTQINTNVLML